MIGIKKGKKMGREEILRRIKKNKPTLELLPDLDTRIFQESIDLKEVFKKNVELVGGRCMISSLKDIYEQVDRLFPSAALRYSYLENNDLFNTLDIRLESNQIKLADLDVLIIEGGLGVAENGAVWITYQQSEIRVLPFITKHLILVVHEKSIVENMHEAYHNLKGEEYGFGVFISGPSKTADIEQSLVIGAQGALSLTVFII
jgi:L-lactate dehydrogenase complex protein LldG